MNATVKQGIDAGFIHLNPQPKYSMDHPPHGYRRDPAVRWLTVYYPDGSWEVVRSDTPSDKDRMVVEGAAQMWKDYVLKERLITVTL